MKLLNSDRPAGRGALTCVFRTGITVMAAGLMLGMGAQTALPQLHRVNSSAKTGVSSITHDGGIWNTVPLFDLTPSTAYMWNDVDSADALKSLDSTSIRQLGIGTVEYRSVDTRLVYKRDAEEFEKGHSYGLVYEARLPDTTRVRFIFRAHCASSSDRSSMPDDTALYAFAEISGPAWNQSYWIPLTGLETAYLQSSGEALQYVMVGVEAGKTGHAAYAKFYAMPAIHVDGRLEPGSAPIMSLTTRHEWLQ